MSPSPDPTTDHHRSRSTRSHRRHRHPTTPKQPTRRPATIAELADRALENLYDNSKDLKHFLRLAEKYRKEGKACLERGDLEAAFVEYARAATLILDKLPQHRDYHSLLNESQRANLGLNGQDILESLADLKRNLVAHHEEWAAAHPNGVNGHSSDDDEDVDIDRTPDSRAQQRKIPDEQQHYLSIHTPVNGHAYIGRSQSAREPSTSRAGRTGAVKGGGPVEDKQVQMVADEVAKWTLHREQSFKEEEAERQQAYTQQKGSGRSDAALAAARQAASSAAASASSFASTSYSNPSYPNPNSRPSPQPSLQHQQQQSSFQQQQQQQSQISYQQHQDSLRQQESIRLQQQQQEAMRKREEEIINKRRNRAAEQEGIVSRLREAEEEARVVRQTIASHHNGGANGNGMPTPSTSSSAFSTISSSTSSMLSSSPMFPSTSSVASSSGTGATTPSYTPSSVSINYPTLDNNNTHTPPRPQVVHAPKAKSRPPSFLGPSSGNMNGSNGLYGYYNDEDGAPSVTPLPLESPSRAKGGAGYEGDSTDSESVHAGGVGVGGFSHADWRRNAPRHVHQGGYGQQAGTPSRTPVRSPSYPPPITTTSPPPSGQIMYPQLMSTHQKTQGYYPSLNSMFTSPHDGYQHQQQLGGILFGGDPNANKRGGLYPSEMLPRGQGQQYGYPGQQQQAAPRQLPQPPPPPPPQGQYFDQPHHQHQTPPHPRPPLPNPPQRSQTLNAISTGPSTSSNPPSPPKLKNVNLPRDCLPRFLAIAKVNTAMNRETCGLLLGKDKGSKYAVTTLLIPKQHSTSDTCTMDEEELVLQFTEERSLITLGWIHTHPSQSCFMSSVDLHTHSGFQRMLPESFAVVCAPKSNPNFGIFRLTDPPGLQTILSCQAKEAFHPHPDLPIYTDADKGHVQMKDTNLEIVDLR